MTNPIIEKAETAAWNSLLAQGVVHDAGIPDVHGELDMTRLVRAVLQAVRDPSSKMMEAGKYADEGDSLMNAEDVWQAMIDAALEEG